MKLILRNTSLVFQTARFVENNPYKEAYQNSFTSKTVSTYPSIYGYEYYGFMCAGIKIRSTLAGDTINIYHGSQVIKTYEYTADNAYVNIMFDAPVMVTEQNPIRVKGAFYYANQNGWPVLEDIDNFISEPGTDSNVYVDFWFIKAS